VSKWYDLIMNKSYKNSTTIGENIFKTKVVSRYSITLVYSILS